MGFADKFHHMYHALCHSFTCESGAKDTRGIGLTSREHPVFSMLNTGAMPVRMTGYGDGIGPDFVSITEAGLNGF